jgi:hypothetical protein
MKYLVEVFWSDDDEGCNATVPTCRAARPSARCPVHEIGDATRVWIAACRASGDPVPEPATKARQAA